MYGADLSMWRRSSAQKIYEISYVDAASMKLGKREGKQVTKYNACEQAKLEKGHHPQTILTVKSICRLKIGGSMTLRRNEAM